MNLDALAQNVKRLRSVSGISQKVLAERSGISLPAIKKLEGAQNEPRVDTLRAIARALNVRLQEILQPTRRLHTVRFRSTKRIRNREHILVRVARWLDDFNALEEMLDARIPFGLEAIRERCSRIDPMEAAASCRRELDLKPAEPIRDICGLLEHAGIKVLSFPYASNEFFGLCIGQDDGGPAVVVNVWEKIPVERRIFSAAHEFGHLLLHRDSLDAERADEDHGEEGEANTFASHFLMPNDGFVKEWNTAAGLLFVERVLKIKRMYGVSYKTVLWRLIDLNEADDTIWKEFNAAFQRRFHRKLAFKEEPKAISSGEPHGLDPIDFHESRFSGLARRAVEEERISLGRGAELLSLSIEEMRERLSNHGAIA